MEVTIFFCQLCNLRKPAQQIADALETELGVNSVLQKGFWGSFRIELNGNVLFDRWKDRGLLGRIGFGRTPTPEEIVSIIQRHLTEAKSTSSHT